MSDVAIRDIITVARFGARLAALAVDSYLGRVVASAKIIGLLPAVPGLLAALPKIRAEWDAMDDDDNWKKVVEAVKDDFDIAIDPLEEMIEESIDATIEILSRLNSIAGRWIAYKRVS